MSDTSSDSSSNTWMIVGCCCCLVLVLIGLVIGYMYKKKGIRSNNLSLIKCAFSSTPLVGTWKDEDEKAGKTILTISYSSPNYTIIVTGTSPDGSEHPPLTFKGTLSGSDLTLIPTTPSYANLDPNRIPRGVLDGLTLKFTDSQVSVFNKISC